MVNQRQRPPRRLVVERSAPSGDDEPVLEADGEHDFVCGQCYRPVCRGVDPERLAGFRLRCPSCGAVNRVPA